MNRITEKDLLAVIKNINIITNSPETPYRRLKNGKLKANIGNYHLDSAYGGYCLHRMHSEGGGVTCPINSGYTTKRDLYNQLQAFIRGIEVKS